MTSLVVLADGWNIARRKDCWAVREQLLSLSTAGQVVAIGEECGLLAPIAATQDSDSVEGEQWEQRPNADLVILLSSTLAVVGLPTCIARDAARCGCLRLSCSTSCWRHRRAPSTNTCRASCICVVLCRLVQRRCGAAVGDSAGSSFLLSMRA